MNEKHKKRKKVKIGTKTYFFSRTFEWRAEYADSSYPWFYKTHVTKVDGVKEKTFSLIFQRKKSRSVREKFYLPIVDDREDESQPLLPLPLPGWPRRHARLMDTSSRILDDKHTRTYTVLLCVWDPDANEILRSTMRYWPAVAEVLYKVQQEVQEIQLRLFCSLVHAHRFYWSSFRCSSWKFSHASLEIDFKSKNLGLS